MPNSPPVFASDPLETEVDDDAANIDELDENAQDELDVTQPCIKGAFWSMKFTDADMEAAFTRWYDSSIVYLQIGLTMAGSHVLIVVRSATDNRLLLLILWLTGISMSLILLLRHHKVGAFRRLAYLNAVLPYLNAPGMFSVGLMSIITLNAVFISEEHRRELVIAHLDRLQERSLALALGWGLAGMLLGTFKVGRVRGVQMFALIVLRSLQNCYVASKFSPPRGLDFLVAAMPAVLLPMLFGYFAVQPYEMIARKLWAQNEGRLREMRERLAALEGHVGVVESYRKRELATRRTIDVAQAQHERRARGATAVRRRSKPVADAGLEPVLETAER